jgi:dipeptidyl aminopeptidase/acylaminoacyl peptidase
LRLRVGQALLVGLLAGPALGAPHTVEELLRPSHVRAIALSPDGTRVALARRVDDADQGDVLTIVAIGDPQAQQEPLKFTLGARDRVSVNWVDWANNRRLLVGVTVDDGSDYSIPSRRTMAIDADGSNPRMLFENQTRLLRRSIGLDRVVGRVPGEPSQVLMPAWTGHSYNLYRVDIESGAATQIARGKTGTFAWEADDGRPALRYDHNESGTTVRVYGRSGEKDEDWSLIVKYGRVDGDALDWVYAGDAPGVGQIYVRLRKDGADTANIYPFDLRSRALGPPVSDVQGYDLDRVFTIDDRFAGVTYFADTLIYALTDARLQKHLEGVQRYFKGEANVYVLGMDKSASRLLLEAVGPRTPGDYYLYDIGRAHLGFIVSAREWLDPERLGPVEVRRTTSRDGTSITSYLTRPIGAPAGPLPLVVMPHGGPEIRDRIDFDGMAQAFAAQGWLVLQPNFRGSSGYGRRFAEAGYRQWSKRMQDDVTDAVTDLVKQGIADRERIVIYGASYGGYAALAGAVATPELYRAAVSLAGLTDLDLFLKYTQRKGGADSEQYEHWVRRMGDPATDAAALAAASPRRRASAIRIPILLMHGSADQLVPIAQSRVMKEALEQAGKSVRLITFEGEDHSGWDADNWHRQAEEAIAFFRPYLQRRAE